MAYRGGKIHLIDYLSLKSKKIGNVFGPSSISGVNGLSF